MWWFNSHPLYLDFLSKLKTIYYSDEISFFSKFLLSIIIILRSTSLIYISYILYEYTILLENEIFKIKTFINALDKDYNLLLNKLDFFSKKYSSLIFSNSNNIGYNNNLHYLLRNVEDTLSDSIKYKFYNVSKFDNAFFKNSKIHNYFRDSNVNYFN